MLTRLSGREHKVFTGFTLVNAFLGLRKTKVISSAVKFKTISPEEREWYVSSSEPYDKAGGYAVQGKGAYFIEKIKRIKFQVIKNGSKYSCKYCPDK